MEQNKENKRKDIVSDNLIFKIIETFKGIKPFIKENKKQYYVIVERFENSTKYKYRVLANFYYEDNERKEVFFGTKTMNLPKLNPHELYELEANTEQYRGIRGNKRGEKQLKRYELATVVKGNTKKVSFLLLEEGKFSEIKLNVFNNVIDQKELSLRTTLYKVPFLATKKTEEHDKINEAKETAKEQLLRKIEETTELVEKHPFLKKVHLLGERLAPPVYLNHFIDIKPIISYGGPWLGGSVIHDKINKTISVNGFHRIGNLVIALTKRRLLSLLNSEMVFEIWPDRIYEVYDIDSIDTERLSVKNDTEPSYVFGLDLIDILISNGLGEKTTLK